MSGKCYSISAVNRRDSFLKIEKCLIHKIALIIAIMLYSLSFCSVVPYICEHIFAALTESQSCVTWLLGLFMALMAAYLAKFARGHEEFVLLRKNTNIIQRRMLENYLYGCHLHATSKDELSGIIYKIAEDVETCRLRIWTNILTIIFTVLFAAAYIITADPVITATIIVVSSLIVMIIFKKRKSLKTLSEDIACKENNIISCQWEYINNREISPHLNYSKLFSRYVHLNEEKKLSTVALAKAAFTAQFARMFGSILLTLITAIAGGILCCTGAMNPSKLFGMLTVIPVLSASLFTLPAVMNDVYSLKGKSKVIPEYLKTFGTQYDDAKVCILYPDIIMLKDIRIGNILKGANFHAHRGRLSVIAGPSGCGKTTLIKVLLCLTPPDSGSISYGDTAVSIMDLSSITKSVFYISSLPYIGSNVSLKDYIFRGRNVDNVYYQQMLSMLKIEYLDTDNPLSAEKLSAGEKQKIMILKMIFDERNIWICDEPTNKLDKGAETQIMKCLKKIIKERHILAVFVSHREETLSAADDLWIMDGGIISECSKQEGDHD